MKFFRRQDELEKTISMNANAKTVWIGLFILTPLLIIISLLCYQNILIPSLITIDVVAVLYASSSLYYRRKYLKDINDMDTPYPKLPIIKLLTSLVFLLLLILFMLVR